MNDFKTDLLEILMGVLTDTRTPVSSILIRYKVRSEDIWKITKGTHSDYIKSLSFKGAPVTGNLDRINVLNAKKTILKKVFNSLFICLDKYSFSFDIIYILWIPSECVSAYSIFDPFKSSIFLRAPRLEPLH